VLPPSADHVKDTFCALFVGASETPARENIASLRPCLVRKARGIALGYYSFGLGFDESAVLNSYQETVRVVGLYMYSPIVDSWLISLRMSELVPQVHLSIQTINHSWAEEVVMPCSGA
jgi:hypothetical protein